MSKIDDNGKTFLVDGPASVTVISGKAEVFGYFVKNTSRIVIREGKRLPFAVKENARFEVRLGKNAKTKEVDGDTVPLSWAEAFETLRNLQKKPAVVMVVGGVDSGKSSFCTYLINKLISEKGSVAVLDGDIGQSDVGPPCTVAYAVVAKPVTDLFELKAENAVFVGVTSPSEDVNRTIKGVASLKTEVLKRNVDFVVVNTDGWVAEENAVNYKVQLAEKLAPDVIFGIQQSSELEPLRVKLENFRYIKIDSAAEVRERSREKRKNLRELGYVKYLANAKVKTWRLSRLNIEKSNPLCLSQKPENSQKGLLLGLHDAQKKFLGIGVLQGIDCERKSLKVLTTVAATPVNVAVGRVRLDDKFHEIPLESG